MFSEVCLFGMPNSGKTTIFNLLTKSNEKVGNWHGVTLEAKKGQFEFNKNKLDVYDLPGVYSLYPVTLEEKISINKVLKTNGLIVFVIEGATLNIAIDMVLGLIKQNKRVLVAVNMVKELYKRFGSIDFEKLKQLLPVPVIYGEFNTLKGIELLKNAIQNYKNLLNFKNYNTATIKKLDFFTPPVYKKSVLDFLTTNKVIGKILLLVIFLFVFYLAFGNYGIGKPLSNLIYGFAVTNLSQMVENWFLELNVSPFATALVIEGVIGGVGGILQFLPQTLILIMAITFLELTGYMARVAYLTDGLLKNSGINGRAVFSILMGFGCTAISVATTNGLENENIKKRATLSLGMISCSAKIPALMLISASFIKFDNFLFISLIYLFGLVLFYIQLTFSKKYFVKGERVPLIMEIPPYRVPKLSDFIKATTKYLKGFILKIITVIFIISITLFLLKSVSIDFKFNTNGYENSFLYYASVLLKFLFYPFNVDSWEVSAMMICGLFAKEGVATAILQLFPNGITIPTSSLIALAVFFYVYTPCVTALSVIKTSFNFKFMVKFAILQFLEAYVLALIVYYLLIYPIIVLSVGLVFGAIYISIKRLKNKKRLI